MIEPAWKKVCAILKHMGYAEKNGTEPQAGEADHESSTLLSGWTSIRPVFVLRTPAARKR
jgi:hypothetical protein